MVQNLDLSLVVPLSGSERRRTTGSKISGCSEMELKVMLLRSSSSEAVRLAAFRFAEQCSSRRPAAGDGERVLGLAPEGFHHDSKKEGLFTRQAHLSSRAHHSPDQLLVGWL